jgi:hypothetical protein
MNVNKKYNMDAPIRNMMYTAEAAVPADMWDRIQQGRASRRKIGWGGFFAAVLLIALLSAWATWREGKTVGPAEGLQTASISIPAAGNSEQSEAVAYLNEDETLNAETSNQDENSGSQGTHFSNTSSKQSGLASNSSLNNNTNNKDLRSATSTLESNDSGAIAIPGDTKSTINGKEANKTKNLPEAIPDFEVATSEENTLSESASRMKYPALSLLGNRNTNGILTDEDRPSLKYPPINVLNKKGGPDCYSFQSFLRGLSIDGYIAPEYASRQLVYKDPNQIAYAEQRKNNENYSFAYSLGFRANAHFKRGLALRTGLVISTIVEKFTYQDPNAQITRVLNISVDTTIINNEIIIVVDTISMVEYGRRDLVGYNSYRFYDIPLMVGYELDRGRWIMHLNTGVLLNVATARRGQFLDPNGNLVSINSNEADNYGAFRKKVGSSLLMSLGVNYALTNKLHFLVEPQLRVWMQPLTVNAYPIDQKYVNLGLALGFRQYF